MSQTREITKLEVVCRAVQGDQMRTKIQQALPPSVDIDRFTRTTLTALQMKPELTQAEPSSLYNSIVRAAQDGLMPDGRQGAIVIYKTKVGDNWVDKAQWMVMVEGCIHKLTKAGVMAYAVSIYENDKFEQWNDETGQHVKHSVAMLGKRGARIGAFALGRVLSTGAVYVEVMDMDELARARAASKSRDKEGNPKGPWKEWPERMEQKSVLHRLDKRIGSGALMDDEEFQPEAGIAADVVSPIGNSTQSPPPPVDLPAEEKRNGKRRSRALQSVIDQAEVAEEAPPQSTAKAPQAAEREEEGMPPLPEGPLGSDYNREVF